MKNRITEYSVKLVDECQIVCIHHLRVQAHPSGGLNLRRARVDAHYHAAKIRQLLRERAVAAAEVENAFARTRRK